MVENSKELLPDILRALTTTQLDFLARRMHLQTDREAADAIGIAPQTVYNWPNKDAVNRAVRLAKLDGVEVGRERLRRLVVTAIDVLEAEMTASDLRNDNRLKAALEVLNRVGLDTPLRQEIKLENVSLTDEERANRIAAIFDAARDRRDQRAGDE